MRKETIERVFADAKEKHAMRYTHHRGLARVKSWVRLKYVAMNLKKLAEWSWNNSFFHLIASFFLLFMLKSPLSPNENRDFFDTLQGDRTSCAVSLIFLLHKAFRVYCIRWCGQFYASSYTYTQK